MNSEILDDCINDLVETMGELCEGPNPNLSPGIVVLNNKYDKYTLGHNDFDRWLGAQSKSSPDGQLFKGRRPGTGAFLQRPDLLFSAPSSAASEEEIKHINNIVPISADLPRRFSAPDFKLAELVFISFGVKRPDDLVDVYVARRGRLISKLDIKYVRKDAIQSFHSALMPAVVLEAQPLGR